MLSCNDISALVSRAQDRRLSWGERLAVRLHLLICHGCRQFARQLRFLRVAGGYFRDHDLESHLDIGLPDTARDRIAKHIARHH